MVKKRIIEPAKGEGDWIQARDVLVKSFHNYPLYVYMEPDEQKRPEFLRRYLEANYEVTVRQGKGYLIIMRLSDDEKPIAHEKSSRIVGALLFIPVAEDGIGWAIQDDQIYFDAYERHKLGEVSSTCMDRVKEYERWEQEHVTKKIRKAKLPLWNGLFCALDSEFCRGGDGTISYGKTLKLMLMQAALKEKISQKKTTNGTEKIQQPCSQLNAESNNPQLSSEVSSEIIKLHYTSFETQGRSAGAECVYNDQHHPVMPTALSYIAGCSMLHHHPIPVPLIEDKNNILYSKENSQVNGNNKEDHVHMNILPPKYESYPEIQTSCTEEEIKKLSKFIKPTALVAICHNSSSAHFHEKNGFRKISEMPYNVEGQEKVPFQVHVLSHDLLMMGSTEKLMQVF